MIPERLLKKYGASVIPLAKGEALFHEGDRARSFFIVRSGKIRMVNYNEEGREFVQGLFTSGESFGEPPFFTESDYPASAEAMEPSEVWKIPRDAFLRLLKENFEIHLELVRTLCTRLIYKSTMLSELAIEEAEHRIVTLLRHLAATGEPSGTAQVRLPFTRQQIADMTGLRVETVIRTIKSLEQKGILDLDPDGKILWKPR
ncbi:MAG: Crp/Fnr family transcriptional regulator [Bacteroidetes bacterium]|nr:Crp/Fnr family transcriptional regulator [Bacteroidota bacterium]